MPVVRLREFPRAVSRASRHRRAQPEARLQRTVFEHIQVRGVPGWQFWATPNAARRTPRLGAELKRQGMTAGVGDISALQSDGGLPRAGTEDRARAAVVGATGAPGGGGRGGVLCGGCVWAGRCVAEARAVGSDPMITMAILRAAGASESLIIRVVELEEKERLANRT